MDPRSAATVTASDLLAAFAEGTGYETVMDEPDLRVFLTLFDRGDDDPQTTEFSLDRLDEALDTLREHLSHGGSRGGAIVIDTFEPSVVSQFEP